MATKNNTYEIKIKEIEGKKYYSTVVRGIEYMIYKQDIYEGADWTVISSRVALGGLKKNPGTHRWFANVDEISKSIKSLKNLSLMIAA